MVCIDRPLCSDRWVRCGHLNRFQWIYPADNSMCRVCPLVVWHWDCYCCCCRWCKRNYYSFRWHQRKWLVLLLVALLHCDGGDVDGGCDSHSVRIVSVFLWQPYRPIYVVWVCVCVRINRFESIRLCWIVLFSLISLNGLGGVWFTLNYYTILLAQNWPKIPSNVRSIERKRPVTILCECGRRKFCAKFCKMKMRNLIWIPSDSFTFCNLIEFSVRRTFCTVAKATQREINDEIELWFSLFFFVD